MNTHIATAIERINSDIARQTTLRDQLLELGTRHDPETLKAEGERNSLAFERQQRKQRATKKRPTPPLKVVKRGPYKKAPKVEVKLDVSPLSEAMIAAGRKVTEPFTAESLATLAGAEMKQAGNAITRWLSKEWIVREGRGEYSRTETFGGEPAAVVVVPAPAKPTPLPPMPAMTADPNKLTPYSEKGIELGGKLRAEFTTDELAALLPQGKQQAYYWTAQWRNKGWIEKRDYEVWHKTKTFGE